MDIITMAVDQTNFNRTDIWNETDWITFHIFFSQLDLV